ncbi:MAG: HAD family hydrolase [Nannocystales bacterium]
MTTPDIILWDVMGTLVHDPFYEEVPASFGMSLEQLLAVKHPSVWSACERGEVSVEDMEANFFADARVYDIAGLRQTMTQSYRWLPGVEGLVQSLRTRGVPMHVVSNYTPWYSMIEDALSLSAWMPWSFVSCDVGFRKPDPRYYAAVLERLSVAAERCVFIDDRDVNCAGAADAGMHTIRFEDGVTTATTLSALGLGDGVG